MLLTVELDLEAASPFPEAPPEYAAMLHALCIATLARVGLAGTYAIGLVLTEDARMRQVNREQRGIDQSTDVLSFPLSERPLVALAPELAWATVRPAVGPFVMAPLAARHLGDIMIALPTVRRQATTAGHSAWWECCYLVVHGVLHLVGYDDATTAGYQAMVEQQLAILRQCQIPRERG